MRKFIYIDIETMKRWFDGYLLPGAAAVAVIIAMGRDYWLC